MAKPYDRNLQIINNLDIKLNIFKCKELQMSVLRNFVNDYALTHDMSFDDDDIDAICEALEFMDVTIMDDSEQTAASDVSCDCEKSEAGETATEFTIEGPGISYGDIEIQLNELLHPKKPDFSELARAGSSAELCRLILDNPENYIKVMYAIRKQL